MTATATATSPRAIACSASLHAVLIALALLVGHATRQNDPKAPVIELVMGPGDNYTATAAPALGVEGGTALELPKLDVHKETQTSRFMPEPAAIVPPPPAPVQPAPVQPKAETPPPPQATTATISEKAPDFKKQMQRVDQRAKAKAVKQVKQQQAAEQKRLDEEKKQMTKAQFDQQNASKNPTKVASNSTRKAPQIDTAGIAKGVVGGSTSNTKSGAGGTALTAAERSAFDTYEAFIYQSLLAELKKNPGLDDRLRAMAEFRVSPDGRLLRGKITESSGSNEFDQAVLRAIAAVRLPSPPKGFYDVLIAPFSTKGIN